MSTSDFNWKGTAMPIAETVPACFCVGPQAGEPLCPCKMRNVKIKNGRYVLPEQDLGPIPTTEIEE